jgi:hypothetical protein
MKDFLQNFQENVYAFLTLCEYYNTYHLWFNLAKYWMKIRPTKCGLSRAGLQNAAYHTQAYSMQPNVRRPAECSLSETCLQSKPYHTQT